MIERKRQNESTYTNVAFSATPANSAWKEIIRASIEISNETLIPGEFGITTVRGTLSFPLKKKKEACSVKMLKGDINQFKHGTKKA
jgi:hypothetical protein